MKFTTNIEISKKRAVAMNNLQVDNIELDNIDTKDYPDFVDAYISYAETKEGVPLTDNELDELNDDRDYVYELVIDYLF